MRKNIYKHFQLTSTQKINSWNGIKMRRVWGNFRIKDEAKDTHSEET